MYISIPCSLLCFSLQYQAFRYLYLCLYIYVHRRCKTCYVCDTSPFVFYGFNGQFNAFLFTLSNPSSSPMKLSIKPENASIAIYNNESDFIARFGLEAYHDLRVGMNSNLPNNDSSIRVGNAYESPNNLSEIDAAIFIKGGKDFLGIFRSCIFFKVLIILSFKRGQ